MPLDAESIRETRIRKGLLQKELAELVGATPQAISQIERKQMRPSRQLLTAIGRVLAARPDAEGPPKRTKGPKAKILELTDPEWLHEKRVVEGLTYQKIASMVGCTRQYVYLKAKEYKLPKPKRRVKKKRKKRVRVIPLKGLIREKRLRGRHKGKLYIARIYPSGRLKMRPSGKLYDSPDAAAKAICKEPTDGWSFWHYKIAKGTWVPLSTLKKQ